MSKVNKGDSVRLVRCSDRYMQAERRNIGKVGVVSDVIRDGSVTYFEVTLPNGAWDYVEAAGLDVTKRAKRVSNKRNEVASV